MNKRQEHVINKAHELFIEKGYHATSIQDILNHSGISKGSFYNYFDSKGELFKAVFTLIHCKLEEERNALLIGQDISDMNIFKEQVVFVMKLNKKNKLLQLVEDAIVSNDTDIILFVKQSKFLFLKWVHERFINLFAEDKKPYLFDCAILFTGFMQSMLQTSNAMKATISLKEIIDYSMDRIKSTVEEVSEKQIQLFSPDHVHKLLPDLDHTDFFNNEFAFATNSLRKTIEKGFAGDDPKLATYLKLLYFIQEELMNNKEPRIYLIESAQLSLEMCAVFNKTKEFEVYRKVLSKMI